MNKIYTAINEKSNGKYNGLRFPKVTFGEYATVTVVCKKEDGAKLNANKQELMSLLGEVCNFHTPIKIEIYDEPPTASGLRQTVVKFTEKFSYVSSIIHTITAQTDGEYSVKMKMHDTMYDFAKDDYLPRLDEFLKNNFVEPIKIDVEKVEFSKSGTVYSAASGGGKQEYALTNVQPVVGAHTPDKAQAVTSITASAYNVTLCGVFAMPTTYFSKGGKRYERFLLYDGETSVQCRFMPDGATSLAVPELLNKTVCVFGNVEYDSMRNEASVLVRELSLCKIDGLDVLQSKPAPNKYERVTPQPYNEYVQSSMFEGSLELPSALKGSFVVFDFETTGLSILYDKPTELGAVKIVDGRITECFSTLIDPRRPIPQEVALKTGITDEMVKGQPLFEDILPDFYRFSYGCSFVCHNIPFDFPFLLKGGNRTGWVFGDRKTYDTMGIAPRALPGIQRLSLDKVLEGLGLVNDNAHRALSDAAVTAKAFVAMHRLLANKNA